MNCLRAVFAHRHVVLPVIHVVNGQQTLQNAQVAYEAGADGVFLINHEVDGKRPLTYHHLLDIHNEVMQTLPDWWIGLNCLDLEPPEVFQQLSSPVAGVWVDNALIDERQAAQPEAERIKAAQTESQWSGLYFGGVAFKYQRDVVDVAAAAKMAVAYTDVLTTSGSATGQAASLTKISQIRAAIGDYPFAIASGLTPENITEYLPWANCFLVATGISRSFEAFDPIRLKMFVDKVRSYKDHP